MNPEDKLNIIPFIITIVALTKRTEDKARGWRDDLILREAG